MQADSDDSSDVVATFSTKLSSLFTHKPLWILDSFRKTLFTSEFIYPRESRRRKWKSWRGMRRPTTHFENAGNNMISTFTYEFLLCVVCIVEAVYCIVEAVYCIICGSSLL